MKIIENKYSNNSFENIKHIDDYGNEYWYARELQKVLEYKDWRNFQKVIDKAVLSANNSVSNEEDWVVEVNKPIKTGKGKEEIIKDYKLSRYICYLIVQNADPSKEVVALGQTYFAIQTRKQEITEQEYDSLSDDEKSEISTKCRQLKLKSKDGKYCETDVLDTKGILRLIESVPSPKVEPSKLWLANLGSERIDEVFNPELAVNRTAEYYRNKGYNK